MRVGATIPHLFRHRIRFVPDDVLAQNPAIVLKCKGDPPGNAQQLLGVGAIAVPKVEPQRSIVPQDPSNFTKHGNQFCNVFGGRHFQTNLPRIFIVSLAEVGRRRDTGVGNAGWHETQSVQAIAKVASVN